MNADQRGQAAGFRKPVLLGLSNASEPNVAVGQDAFVLGVQEDLQQTEVRFKQLRGFGGLDLQQFAVHVADQNLGVVQHGVALLSSHASLVGQLPGFLSTFVPLNGSGVLLDEQFLEQVSHGPADVGRVLCAGLCDAGSSEAWRNHVAVRPVVVGQQVQEHPIFGCDVHLGDVARHACGWLHHLFKTLLSCGASENLFEHFCKKPFIGIKLARVWQIPARPNPIENAGLSC